MTENIWGQSYSFYNQQLKNKLKALSSEDFVLISLPHLRHRYIYQILHLFHLAYPQVAFFWDFSLDNYIKLGNEGRRLFSILNLKIISNVSTQINPSTFVSPGDGKNFKFSAINPKLRVIINTDLSQKAKEESLLIPYSVHPHFLQDYKVFNQEIIQLRSNYREISVFFAGNIQNLGDKHLVERFYDVPSRDRCIQFLLKSS